MAKTGNGIPGIAPASQPSKVGGPRSPMAPPMTTGPAKMPKGPSAPLKKF